MRSLKLAVAALAAALLLPATAAAAPAVDGVFSLPDIPHQLALGPDGNVWITLDGLANNIARVRPDGTVDSFTSPDISNPIGIVAGPDGQLWVTESGAVAHFSPADPTAARRVDIAGLIPNRIVVGPDRDLWTASGDSVVRIRTDERFDTFRPAGLQGARGIAAGGDGNLYVADFLGAQILGVTTAGVAAGAYPTGGGNPQEVAAGTNGQMGFTNPLHDPQQIGRFSPPDTSSVRTVDFAPGTDPTGIVFAQDGAYWVADRNDQLTRMAPDGTVTTLTGFPRASGPRHLTVGRDGTLWVGLETTRQVARVTGVTAPPSRGGGGNPGPDVTAPVVSGVSAPASLRVGRSGSLRLTLSEAATVTIRFERKLPGRRNARGRCVKPRRHGGAHGRRCTRFKAIGTQTRRAAAGADALALGGKLGRRTIPAGRYRLTIVATDAAGNASAPISRTLKVVARRKAPRRAAPSL